MTYGYGEFNERDEEDALTAGVNAGISRISPYFDIERNRLLSIEEDIRSAIDDWPFELNDPFVALFAEVVTVAATARIANEERPLDTDEILAYLAHSYSFLNSWKHL